MSLSCVFLIFIVVVELATFKEQLNRMVVFILTIQLFYIKGVNLMYLVNISFIPHLS